MSQVTIDIEKVDRIPGSGRNIEIEAVYENKKIIRTISLDDFDNFQDFATWLINQRPDRESQDDWRKRLVIDFHTETVEDGTIRVVDNVDVQELSNS